MAALAASIVALPAQSLASGYVWGTYEGYPVAHVMVNGGLLTPDVPAIIVNGRTMVPISYAAKAIDGVATWDQTTMTASISTEPTDAQYLAASNGLVNPANQALSDVLAVVAGWQTGKAPTQADATALFDYRTALMLADAAMLTIGVNGNDKAQFGMAGDETLYLAASAELASTAYLACESYLQGNVSQYTFAMDTPYSVHLAEVKADWAIVEGDLPAVQAGQ